MTDEQKPGADGQAQSPPAVAPLLDGDGNLCAGFPDHPLVPEDLRADQQLKTHAGKPFASFAKNWSTLQSIRGDQVVPVPGHGADDAKWDLVFDRLGRPAQADGYTLPDAAASGLKPEQQAPAEFVDAVRQVAHKARLTDAQFGAMISGYNKLVADTLAAADEKRANDAQVALQELRTQWSGQYEPNVAAAAAALKSTAAPEDVQALTALGLLEKPEGLRWLHKLSGFLKEAEPDTSAPTPAAVAATAQSELNRITNDPQSPLYDDHHPQHKDVVARFRELGKVIAGGQEATP